MLSFDRQKIIEIAIDKIEPNPAQPRRNFPEEELKGLANSIASDGLLQPITVRKVDGKYQLIAGERRLRACRIAGFQTVPCVINDCDDKQAAIFAMIENLQRQNLQIFEEAEGIQTLIAEWGVTQEEAAIRLGKSQSTLANKMRLLRLPPADRKIICDAGLTERHARALLRIENDTLRKKVLNDIIQKNLNVQQTDEFIDRILEGKKAPKIKPKRTFIVKDVRIFMNTINHAIETMKTSGINVVSENKETEDYIECVVRIPKKTCSADGKSSA